MTPKTKRHLTAAAVWAARIAVGVTFIISGWAKAIDPWGFLLKVNEYIAAWGYVLPRELVLAPSIALSCVEFCTGILIAVGALKRTSVWTAAAMMAFMLPLTVYIAMYNTVSDCGCFGDFIVISNAATLAKNIVLTGLIVFLILYNRRVAGLYAAPIQWLVITASLAYPLLLSLTGFNVQPLVDFRPYKVGTPLFAETAQDTPDTYYIYERDGERRQFGLSELPDSSWTFVDMVGEELSAPEAGFEIRDNDGNAINDELADATPALFLIVPHPDMSFLSYTHYVNTIAERADSLGITTIGVAGTSGDALGKWAELMRPRFEIYSAEDTSLKQLARGDAALVFVDDDGIIRWKRSLASVGGSMENPTEVEPIDDGRLNAYILAAYAAIMAIIYMLSLSPKILRLFARRKEKNM